MKSSRLRLIILVTLLACCGVIVTQMFWVRRAYALEERSFNFRVLAALRDAAANVARVQGAEPGAYSPVEQLEDDLYLIHPNTVADQAVLQHYLAAAFTAHDVVTDFRFARYDCGAGRYAFQEYYHTPNSGEQPGPDDRDLPLVQREDAYVAVHFPHRMDVLETRLSAWTASSIALIGIIGFLGYLLIMIFRQKMLSEVQKDFVANMTHEFQTPLAAIHLSANVLKNPKILAQPHRLLNYATIIANESAGLTAQVQRVLQANSSNAKALELSRDSFVWQDVLRDAVGSYEAAHPAQEGRIRLHMAEQPLYGHGDVAHLRNVVSNLQDNAVKYNHREPDVRVTLRQGRDRQVSIAVMDNGIGIAPEHRKRLFKKFYRVPTGHVHDVKGFGLGLNYVWLLMRAHGGSVHVSSEAGKGSTFTLTFPPAIHKNQATYERAQSEHPAGRR